MSMFTFRCGLVSAIVGLALSGNALAVTEITFWHSMESQVGQETNALVTRFNQTHPDYKVVASYKGGYEQSLANGIAAIRNGKSPDILQVYEIGTTTMMASRAIVPVHQIFKDAGIPLDEKEFVAPVAGYYSDSKGQLISMPFNSSTHVIFYNKDAFRKAGLNPDQPPKTWQELEKDAEALRKSGMSCGYGTSRLGIHQIVNFSAWHALPIATKNNGLDGFDAELNFNNPTVISHIQMLEDMYKKGDLTYLGRQDEAATKFYSGECGIATGSSGAQSAIQRYAKFDWGVGMMPYDETVPNAPQNAMIGGASLWVIKGKDADTYKGVAEFMQFLDQPENQAEWHQKSGYLPVTLAAYELTKKEGFYNTHPGMEIAMRQLMNKPPLPYTRGYRLGNMTQILTVIDEELEDVFAGNQTPKAALDNSVKRGNELLRRFEQQVK
ncbi:sn-glycerol-3-phosphate ABC transporter substrate-binding protein UgpB [Rahnella sp. CG8]|uniref:sn-glycerol-3-phosphate ABC transporter substrate-binding protein UgpB n=1 Tax=Yersiniaceae TaxID=1903411 RepID=UPI001013C734|nr:MULTISPECIES: sn-glycerol-3-phosphate ABC transporter substrate-binding protein UgpB [Yersiniaceae]MCM2446280.1 sn-glycerol-3-phosphate ABC transporter substrate-binding protein UgpB [Rahnella sp. CG8]